MRECLVTPDPIKAKAVDVLRQLDGLSYADAVHALDVAQRTLAAAIERLHEEQTFSPPIFRQSASEAEGCHPEGRKFSPELEAAADRVAACAGFRFPPVSTSAEKSPEHARGAACSPGVPAPVGSKPEASGSAPLDSGES